MQQTILITGGAGYIGSHTAYLMAQKGYNIIILDTLLHGQPFDHPWATLIKEDFANPEILKKIFTQNNIVAVMHFAAFIEVGQSVKEPLRYFNNNVTKTLELLETMLAHQIKNFIFSSSCAIYGEPQELPIPETHPKNPISPYGNSKLMIEMALHDLATAYDLHYVALRYFNAAGASPEHGLGEYHKPETHLIPLLLSAARNQTPFSIFGTDHPTPDGTCVRDYLHVLDIAHAHAQALDHLLTGHPSDAFNLGTGKGISVKQMVDAVEKMLGTKLSLILAKPRPGDPPVLVADPTKAQTILRWKPLHSDLDTILRSAYLFEYGDAKR